MLDNYNAFNSESLQKAWNKFCEQVKKEIKRLKEEKEQIDSEINKHQTEVSIIKNSKDNIEFMLKYKNVFIKLDESLKVIFAALEQFQNMNALNNSAVPYLCQQIFASEHIQEISQKIDQLIEQSQNVAERIARLNDLRFGIEFDDELIKELCAKANFSQLETRLTRFYCIRKASKKKPIVIERSPEIPTVAPEEEPVIPEIPNNEPETNEPEVIPEEPIIELENPVASEVDRIVEQFEEKVKKYNDLKEKYNDLLNKYYGRLNFLKSHEYAWYKRRAENAISIEDIKAETEDEKIRAILLAFNVFSTKEAIEKEISEKKERNQGDIEYLEYCINEFKGLLEELTLTDEKIKGNGPEEITVTPSNVYFLVDETGKLVMPSDESAFVTYERIAGTSEVDNFIKKTTRKLPDSDKEKTGGRVPIVERISKYAISFLKVKTGEGTSGNGILVIATASVSSGKGGFEAIDKETNRVIDKYSDQIIKQIRLIESRNSEYLKIQEKIQGSIIASGRKGGSRSEQ